MRLLRNSKFQNTSNPAKVSYDFCMSDMVMSYLQIPRYIFWSPKYLIVRCYTLPEKPDSNINIWGGVHIPSQRKRFLGYRDSEKILEEQTLFSPVRYSL
jgi:hypothetical protein